MPHPSQSWFPNSSILGWFVLAVLLSACRQEAGPVRSAPILWRLRPDLAPVADPAVAVRATWVPASAGLASSLMVVVPAEAAGSCNTVRYAIDLRPWRGSIVSLHGRCRADGVSAAPHAWNGVKCMLGFSAPSLGGAQWIDAGSGLSGTFDWRPVAKSVAIPEDATDGTIYLGLEESHGKVAFTEVVVAELRRPVERPAAAASAPMPTPRYRGFMNGNRFDAQALHDLAQWNANLVRWQLTTTWAEVGGDRDLAQYDRWLDGKLAEVDRAVAVARQEGLRLVIDLHSPPGGRYENKGMAIFQEAVYQHHFIAVWERIARRYRDEPVVWAYELVNEPVQHAPEPDGVLDWWELQERTAAAIRAIDPMKPIIATVDDWSDPARFAWMRPLPQEGIIYTAHMYWPNAFTHQGVHGGLEHPLTYPGTWQGAALDREALRRHLQPLRDFQLSYQVPVYIGEFSAIRWAPGADRYLADAIAIFEEYGWHWSYHAFREWGGWSLEAADLPYDPKLSPPAREPTARAQVVRAALMRNMKPQAGREQP